MTDSAATGLGAFGVRLADFGMVFRPEEQFCWAGVWRERMAAIVQEQVIAALRGISAPQGGDVVSAGWVGGVTIRDGHVMVTLEVPPELGPSLEPVRKAAEQAVHALPGVLTSQVVLTAHNKPGQSAAAPHSHSHSHSHSHAAPQGQAHGRPAQGMLELPGVKKIIAVASGKGGVGKSTTAANLALALSKLGLKVGLFDADIYGPSVPRLMGIPHAKPTGGDHGMEPLEAHGLKVMSIGFLVPEDSPVVWRGPMVMGALEQMLRDVNWGDLDVMVVDMPPGTGDTQLTMSQRVPLAGAVIVSTPQDIALLDARKGLSMFEKVKVPILGIIENMSYHVCSNCGHREDVFSHGGARRTAEELGTPFLGEIPLDIRIRETADSGTPIVVADPDGEHAKAYGAIAEALRQTLKVEKRKKPLFKFFG